jgi:hypothetical protein
MTRFALAVLLLSQTAPQRPTAVDALARAEAKWQATKPAVYEFSIDLTTFGLREGTPPAFRVTNGTPVLVKPADPKKAGDYSSFDTIDELFAIIKLYAPRDSVKFSVQYDAEFGFPVSADLDAGLYFTHDELAFKVSGFRVVTK